MENGDLIYYCLTNDRVKLIEYFYSLESETFFKEIHKCRENRKAGIESTLASIEKDAEVYEVYYKGNLAAFFAKVNWQVSMLNGFHVKKEYRTKYFLSEFWEVIKTVFSSDIYTGLWEGNYPAINHLLKNGFELVNTVEHKGLNYKIFTLCQQPQQ